MYRVSLIMTACGGNANNSGESEASAENKEVKNEFVNVKGEWDIIDPEDEVLRNNTVPYLTKTKEVGGFEIGKPKGSKINEAYWFYGENELRDTAVGYLMRFNCGETQISSAYYDGYAQAVWDACKNVADDSRMFLIKSGKEEEISSLEDATRERSAEGNELDHRFGWYIKLNGVTLNFEISPEMSRNSNNERVQNVIKLNVQRKK